MITIQDIEKIEKYLEGKLSDVDLKDFKQQLSANPEIAELVENFKFAVEGVNVYSRNQLKAKFGQIQKEVSPVLPKGKSFIKYYIGGAALLVLIGAFFIFNPLSKQSNEKESNLDITAEKINTETQESKFEAGHANNQESAKLSDESNLNDVNTGEIIETSPIADETPIVNNKEIKPDNINSQQADDQIAGNTGIDQHDNNKISDDIPEAHFLTDKSSGCAPITLRFTDNSSIANGTITKWLWHFGDGSTSTLQNPSHTFKNDGDYTIHLTVWSKSGKYDMNTKENFIHVFKVPDASFISDPEIVSANRPDVQFINRSKNTTAGSTYKWDFGDHFGSSTKKDPEYSYSDTGSYIISLSVTTENGCIDKAFRGIIVVPEVSCYMPDAFSPDGKGPNINNTYQVSAAGFAEFYMIIYNRLGDVVHESKDYKNHEWDGSSPNGNLQNSEAEVYIVKVRLLGFDGKAYDYKKSLTLIR